jgi:hypothetical protein
MNFFLYPRDYYLSPRCLWNVERFFTSVLWIRIRTTDLRIRILLFSSVDFKMPMKNKFLFVSFFAYYIDISHTEVTKQEKPRFFLLLFARQWKDPDTGGPKS